MALLLRDAEEDDRRFRHGAYFDGHVTLCGLYVADPDLCYAVGLLETARAPMNCSRCRA